MIRIFRKEIISQMDKYARLLKENEISKREVSDERVFAVGKELILSIQEINNYLKPRNM